MTSVQVTAVDQLAHRLVVSPEPVESPVHHLAGALDPSGDVRLAVAVEVANLHIHPVHGG